MGANGFHDHRLLPSDWSLAKRFRRSHFELTGHGSNVRVALERVLEWAVDATFRSAGNSRPNCTGAESLLPKEK